tara:strand:- start:65 stop:715 length:651 start_codon:yes stop_codon:yes gene_type:complete
MKKLLASLAIFASLGTPVLADPVIEKWKTSHAMGCMMVQDCTDGVEEVTKWEDLGPQFEPFSDELGLLISEMNKMGVKVFLADDKYFWSLTRGLYYVKGNNMFLNKKYLSNPLMMTKVVRHEAWHATQDCMAGTIDNTFTAVILKDGVVPDWVKDGAERTYPENAAPYEAEAMWAAFNPGLVIQGVQACAGDVPMWKVFEPTPLTKKWLIEQGFYK